MKTAIIMTLAALLVLFTLCPSPALAWDAHSLTLLTSSNFSGLDSDGFWNYDFTSQSVSSSKVDFPITMVFVSSADKFKVRGVYWGEATVHSAMNGRLKDDPSQGYVWNSDKGTRSNNTPYPNGTHMRMYAANDSHMYNQTLGKYLIGSTHYDRLVGAWREYGWSETCEADMAQTARDKGCGVVEDAWCCYNDEPYRVQRNWGTLEMHIWENNGYATAVFVW